MIEALKIKLYIVISLKNKFKENSNTYLIAKLQIIYIISYISNNTLILISLYLDIISYYTYKMIIELYKYFKELYSNLNKEYNTYQIFKELVIKKS